jgi:oligosaccharyltransferase complex subunit delta (ribophorin II)
VSVNALQSTVPSSAQEKMHNLLLKSLGGNQTSLKNLHHTLLSLIKLPYNNDKSKNEIKSQKENLCKSDLLAVTESSVSGLEINDLYDMVTVISALGCSIPESISKAIESRLRTLAGGVSTPEEAYEVARCISLFEKHLDTLPSDKTTLDNLLKFIQGKYNEKKGAYCTDSDNVETCIRDTGYAYETLFILSSLVSDIKSSIFSSNLKQLTNLIRSIDDKTSIDAVAAFVRGLTKLAKIVPLKDTVDEKYIDNLADYFVSASLKPLNTVSSIYNFAEGTSSIAKNPIHTPVYVSQINRRSNTAVFTVTVSNIFGTALEDKDLKVVLNSLYKGSNPNDSLLLKPVTFSKESGTVFSWDASKTKIFDQTGTFNFDLEVQPLDYKVTRTYRSFVGSISIENLSVSGDHIPSQTIKFGERLNTFQIAVTTKSRMTISFRLTGGVNPHQVFVRFTNNKGQDAAFAAKASDSSYKAEIKLYDLGKLVRFRNGTYEMQVLVGDASISDPIQWIFGSVECLFIDKEQLTEEQLLYAPREEIGHKFAPPAKRAPQSISSTFTALVAVPFAIFLLSILRVGFNFNRFPSGVASIAALVFIGLLAVILYVLARFFIDTPFFPTLYRLAALSIATGFVGVKVLSAIAAKK